MLVRQDLLEKTNFFIASVQFPLSNPANVLVEGKLENLTSRNEKFEITYVGKMACGGL